MPSTRFRERVGFEPTICQMHPTLVEAYQQAASRKRRKSSHFIPATPLPAHLLVEPKGDLRRITSSWALATARGRNGFPAGTVTASLDSGVHARPSRHERPGGRARRARDVRPGRWNPRLRHADQFALRILHGLRPSSCGTIIVWRGHCIGSLRGAATPWRRTHDRAIYPPRVGARVVR